MQFKKILAAFALSTFLVGCGSNLSADAVKSLSGTFINENLLVDGATAEIGDVTFESGLWRVKVKLSSGMEVDAMLSADGKYFIPEVFDIENVQNAAEGDATEPPVSVEVPKNDRPVVELFVMSHCPFGTQSEKAVIPAIGVLGDAVDFKLKFVDYVMHGEKEVNEQLREFAIAENYPDKLIPYLNEFLVASDSAVALAAVGLSDEDLATTIAAADAEFAIFENLNNTDLWLKNQAGDPSYPHFDIHSAENEKYGVRGSPTLVVNGQLVEGVARTPAAMLDTFCAAFESVPVACATEVSSDAPSAGFGWDVTTTSTDGECS